MPKCGWNGDENHNIHHMDKIDIKNSVVPSSHIGKSHERKMKKFDHAFVPPIYLTASWS